VLKYSKGQGAKLLVYEGSEDNDFPTVYVNDSIYVDRDQDFIQELEIGSKEYYVWIQDIVKGFRTINNDTALYLETCMDDGVIDIHTESDIKGDPELADCFEKVTDGLYVFIQ
jgi:hypothetical protein